MGFWFVGVVGLFLIKAQGVFCLISTSQQVGEYFMKTLSQIFSPTVHLTSFRGKCFLPLPIPVLLLPDKY